MSRSARTEKNWPTETPDELIERTRREHGDAAADYIAKVISGEAAVRDKRRKPKRVKEHSAVVQGQSANRGSAPRRHQFVEEDWS